MGQAQRAVCCSFLMSNTLMLLTGWLGLVMYAAYQHCDPITAGQVTTNTAVYSLSASTILICLRSMQKYLSKRDVAKPMSLQNTLNLHIPVSFELGCGWLCMTIILRKKYI